MIITTLKKMLLLTRDFLFDLMCALLENQKLAKKKKYVETKRKAESLTSVAR